MDDRLLVDIGLTRQQVEYIAKHGRWPTETNPARNHATVTDITNTWTQVITL
jgi:hypothetical protein